MIRWLAWSFFSGLRSAGLRGKCMVSPPLAALVCCMWLALLIDGKGGGLPAVYAAAPESGILDASGFFGRKSGAMERISGWLLQLEQEHHYRLYFVVEPVLIGTSGSELAARLQEAWLPDGNGLVVVYESGSRNLCFGRDFHSDSGLSSVGGTIPTHETEVLLQKAVAATDADLEPEAYLETLVGNLAGEFRGYFQRRSAPPPRERSLRLALLTIGGLALGALGVIGAGALARLRSAGAGRCFRFAGVDSPERLGAPSGGSPAVRRFRTGMHG